MKANLNVEGFAYFEIEIEGSTVPPSMNIIDSIFIHEGIGIAIPTLRMQLYDQRGTLYRDLNLTNMTRVIVTMAKKRNAAEKRKFRFFGCRKETTHAGPILIVDCILDVPKWSTGSYCEPFVGTSSDAISGAAAAAGLRYSGPRVPTNDVMNWLNVNQTRSSFSEDVAVRGYVNDKSAMCRVLNSLQEVRYRDLFDAMQQEPTVALLQNVPSSAAGGMESYSVRETKDGSLSGFFTHYVNFGWKLAHHSLNVQGQQVIDKYNAPILGKALPINEEVRAMLEGARVSYVADDPGTAPKPASNLHQFYERAFYQNIRGTGLFTEKVSLLIDWKTDVQVLDPIEYKQHELQSYKFIDVPALSGRWLVAGKTLYLKNGHKYSEIFDLVRPFINELGASAMTGDESTSGVGTQATANSGKFDLTGTPQSTVQDNTSRVIEQQQSGSNAPSGVQAATDTMQALKDYDEVSPLVPTISAPTSGGSWPTEQLQVQDNLRNAVSNLAQQSNPNLPVIADGDIDGFKIIKKVSAPLLETLANIGNNPQEAVYLAQNLEDGYWIKTQAIERATSVGSDVTGIRLGSIVSAATGGYYSPGAIVGDVLGGGVWSADLANAGVPIPDVDIPILGEVTDFGGKLLFEATGVGLNGSNVLIDPYKTASAINAFASGTTPEQYLAQYGVDAFIQTFGDLAPPEAQAALENLGYLARDVMYRYSPDEKILDYALTNSQMINAGRDIAFLFGDPSVVPIVDRVANVAHMADYTEINTDRKLVTWAQYYALGATAVEAGADSAEDLGVQWKFPFNFPSEPITDGPSTGGYPNFLDDKTQNWYNRTGTTA